MNRRVITGLTVIAALVAGRVGAQVAASETGPVIEELSRLNETLVEIKGLLAQQVEAQTLDLLMKRTELASSRVARLEGQLESAESRRRSLADEKESTEASLNTILARLDSGTMEIPSGEEEAFLSEMQGQLTRLKQNLQDAELEIAELQGRLADQRRELREWQSVIDSRLAGS